MKARLTVIAAAAAVLTVAACGSGTNSGNSAQTPKKLTVWLQVDAQKGWPKIVQSATDAVKAKHPGVTVDVQYQTWPQHLTKLDAALSGNSAPDVVEMGNTEMAKYMAAGAFADLTAKKSQFPNSDSWVQSLADSATYQGKTFGVPYYAGARAVIYRKSMFAKAGISQPPTSLDEFVADAGKLQAAYGSDPQFSAFYQPGRNWYSAMTWVTDFGGKIATESGKTWTGALNSSAAQEALTSLKSVLDQYSKADKNGDESTQPQAFAQGHIAMMYANGWEWGSILDPKTGNPALADDLAAFPMPSRTAGQTMPVFLGGSDLAIPAASKNQDLAVEWIAAFTSTQAETSLAKDGGNIPNTTTLVDLNKADPKLGPFAAGAKQSWFVPSSPNWANVESGNVLQNMLSDIFTGKASVADATKSASDQITKILNEGS